MGFGNIFLLVLTVFTWGFLHSLTASYQFKTMVRRLYGQASDRFYRLAYNLFSVLSFIIVLVIAAFTPDTTLYVIPFPWVIFFIIVDLLAVAALVTAFYQTDALECLGIRQITRHRRKDPSKLVTSGLFHYVRHPGFIAGLVFIWALPLMTARVFVLGLALTAYTIVGAFLEERKLRQKFGPEYTDYAAVTPMFIPFINRLRLPRLLKGS